MTGRLFAAMLGVLLAIVIVGALVVNADGLRSLRDDLRSPAASIAP